MTSPRTVIRSLLVPLLAGGCRCAAPPAASTPSAIVERPAAVESHDHRHHPGTSDATTTALCPLPASLALGTDTDGTVDGNALLEAAFAAFERAWTAGRNEEALACAQEAARVAPDEPASHLDRGLALEALGRREAAREAFARALALAPDNVDALRITAEHLAAGGSEDALETAVVLARRARSRDTTSTPEQLADLAALEAGALNDLGRSSEARVAAEAGLALDPACPLSRLERGVAAVESLDFETAGHDLMAAHQSLRDVEDAPARARAAWFLGVLRERVGEDAEAERLFGEAAQLDPELFPRALELPGPQFESLIQQEIAALTESERRLLAAVDFSWQELPAMVDLQAGDPVLSPSIVGLFRPAEAGRRPAIFLYRRPLLRLAHDLDGLRREVRRTLQHELGHLEGADDAQLRDRGL